MAAINADTAASDRRQIERRTVELPGKLILGERVETCTVYDISPKGANVSAPPDSEIGGEVRLRVTRHGEFVGKIVWQGNGNLGLTFFHFETEPLIISDADDDPARALRHLT